MKKNYFKILTIFLILLSVAVSAQDYERSVRNYLKEIDINAEDIQELAIIDEVHTARNGVTRVYLSQQINGIPINNATVIASFKNGELIYTSHSLVNDIASRAVSSTSPSLSPIDAASSAGVNLGLSSGNFQIINAISSQEYLLSNGGVSQEDTPVKLVYTIDESQGFVLAWDLSILPADGKHWWSMRVNATTGEIVEQNDWMLTCTFPEHNHKTKSSIAKTKNDEYSFQSKLSKQAATAAFAGEQYFVYAVPLESPLDGTILMVLKGQNSL